MQTYRVPLPYTRPPLTANQRSHRMAVYKKQQELKKTAHALALQRGMRGLGPVRVTFEWIVTDNRKRDGGENITDTLKPLIDGLVAAGVVPDDDPAHVVREMPRIVKGSQRQLVLLVTPLTTPHPDQDEHASRKATT